MKMIKPMHENLLNSSTRAALDFKALLLIATQITLTLGGQMLWKKGISQIGEFVLSGQMILQLLIKLATNYFFLTGTIMYVMATLMWFYLLSRFEFSLIYPILSLSLVISILAARLFLGESISVQRWFAVGLISLGIFLLVRS